MLCARVKLSMDQQTIFLNGIFDAQTKNLFKKHTRLIERDLQEYHLYDYLSRLLKGQPPYLQAQRGTRHRLGQCQKL